MVSLSDKVYMVAGGVPDRRADHADRVAAVAVEFRTKVTQINVPDTDQLHISIGTFAFMTRITEAQTTLASICSGGFVMQQVHRNKFTSCTGSRVVSHFFVRLPFSLIISLYII